VANGVAAGPPSAGGSGAVAGAGPGGAVVGSAGGPAAGGGVATDNGGATDIGVTPTTIKIANISDITGVVPGIFESAQLATEAYAAYVNSQGGVYGRQLDVLPYDDQEDSAQNRAAVLDACKKAFALVGGLSAFDDESPPAIHDCNIPDVAGGTATDPASNSREIFTPGGNFSHNYPIGPAVWFVQHFPNEVKHAAIIYLNAAATIEQADHRINAYHAAGFNWVYKTEVSVTEPNYAPYVLQMRSMGVQWVTMQADGNSDARLVGAMQQQNWHPNVLALDQAVYSPGFLQAVGHAADGNYLVLQGSMFEDAPTNPQMAQYIQWLTRINPSFPHDYWGFSAWAATALFVDEIKAVGPHLTRAALFAQLRKTGSFDGAGGILAPNANVAQRVPSPCFVMARIENARFVRDDPASGYTCNLGGLYKF
jgi:ABC-type branched-subunit amino acid transport system substrate-binding protein